MRLKRSQSATEESALRTDRLSRRAARATTAATAAAAAAIVVVAGCSSSGGNGADGGGHPSSPGSPTSPASQPARTPTASPSSGPGNAARAAENVQGPAAVSTAAQRKALAAERGTIARLSPAQLAGQRVIYSYSGFTAPSWLLTDIRKGLVGGVIFFSFNISSEQQIRAVIEQLIAANASGQNPAHAYPLLLMTDQEGGQVRRLPGAPDQSEAQIGASSNPSAAAAAAGTSAAANLRGVGMNVNLAPVLDVFRRPGDFDDQYQRSYSMNPQVVGTAGASFVTAQQAGGVAATVKHFPGLGAAGTTQDTDNEPVSIGLSAQQLRTVDDAPYRAAVQAGVKLAMVSWATYPALGTRLPAALSPAIVQGELQSRVGFQGVTITDALGAGALGAYGSVQNRTMLAARAGMDALLCTATKPLPAWKCVAGLQQGYQDGALPKATFEGQLAQVLALRASLPV
jgi:beta-N-acetylhexosaminidase